MESASTLTTPTPDLGARRAVAHCKLDVARLYLKDAMQALDCPELREQHVAIGTSIIAVDDVVEALVERELGEALQRSKPLTAAIRKVIGQ